MKKIIRTEPKTAEPKTAEPKTAEPKTAEPKTAEPKTAEPKTAVELSPLQRAEQEIAAMQTASLASPVAAKVKKQGEYVALAERNLDLAGLAKLHAKHGGTWITEVCLNRKIEYHTLIGLYAKYYPATKNAGGRVDAHFRKSQPKGDYTPQIGIRAHVETVDGRTYLWTTRA